MRLEVEVEVGFGVIDGIRFRKSIGVRIRARIGVGFVVGVDCGCSWGWL